MMHGTVPGSFKDKLFSGILAKYIHVLSGEFLWQTNDDLSSEKYWPLSAANNRYGTVLVLYSPVYSKLRYLY